MTVAQILSEKGRDVVTVDAHASTEDVMAVLAGKKIGAAVVMNDQALAGIVSERDIIRILANNGRGALESEIASCMTKKVVSCTSHDTIDHVMQEMTRGRFRHMPVVDDGELVGLVSIGDVVKRKIEQAERDAEDLKRYIAS